jgi:predicted small lipoprotein YifL
LTRIRLTVRIALVAAGIAASGLSACGREGPLELPPGPAAATPPTTSELTLPDGSPAPGSAQDTAMKTGFDAQGNPVATPGQKKSFILDPLLQ